MALVHKQSVHTKLLKGHHIILTGCIVQLIQLRHKGLAALLHLLDGIALAPLRLCQCYRRFDFLDLTLYDSDLSLRGKRDLLKLTVPDDDCIIIPGSDTGTKLLPVGRLKILFRSRQDICSGIES